MKTSTLFSTPAGNSYLFDIKKQYLLNLHPVIELIHNCSKENASEIDTTQLLSQKYPALTDAEIRMYQGKYAFLKTHGFFDELNADEMLAESVTPNTVKSQLINP